MTMPVAKHMIEDVYVSPLNIGGKYVAEIVDNEHRGNDKMGKAKPRKENYLLAGCLFFILFLITAGWLLIPGLRIRLAESQRMLALRDQGVVSTGCITQKDAHEGFRRLPEVFYDFQTPNGVFEGRIGVAVEFFEQVNIGTCLSIVYLPNDPNTNSLQSYVESFNLSEHWSEDSRLSLTMVSFVAFMTLLAAFSYPHRHRFIKLKQM
jgi:hypothetical protein